MPEKGHSISFSTTTQLITPQRNWWGLELREEYIFSNRFLALIKNKFSNKYRTSRNTKANRAVFVWVRYAEQCKIAIPSVSIIEPNSFSEAQYKCSIKNTSTSEVFFWFLTKKPRYFYSKKVQSPYTASYEHFKTKEMLRLSTKTKRDPLFSYCIIKRQKCLSKLYLGKRRYRHAVILSLVDVALLASRWIAW